MIGFIKKVVQSYIKQFGAAILCIGIIFAGILLSSCQLQRPFAISNDRDSLNVVVEYERHEDLPDIYKIDVVIPKIESSGDTIKTLNETIRDEFMEYYELNAGNANEILGGWRYPQIDISYKVVRIKQICAISIITEIHSEQDQGRESSVRSYYYDELQKKILSSKEYLEKLGLTPDEVEQAFLEGVGQNYNLEHVAFSSLQNHFYINEKKQPVFFVVD
ncbi:hypothetical protein [Anaerovorax sp. IOR16]|uniref:hypothetical protein n=1 Tax=Anaerovorax sp. IOR16 TaxID=2773458 RepID=UPI0019CFE269|nr:hypothetical protein [Anaerovorax sp. IOR16]